MGFFLKRRGEMRSSGVGLDIYNGDSVSEKRVEREEHGVYKRFWVGG